MFTSLKRPNRYTKCTKKTLIKQTLCVDCAAFEHQHQKTSIFLDFLHFDTESTVLSERSAQKTYRKGFFAEDKEKKFTIFRLKSDQCFKSSLSLRMILHYKDEVSHFFFPLMAISFLRLSKVSRKKFLSFSLEVVVLFFDFFFISAKGAS